MTKKPDITLTPIKHSSQIEGIGHHGDTLAVKYHSGQTYLYHGVTPAQYADLQKAESVGKHLNTHIKPKHKFVKQ